MIAGDLLTGFFGGKWQVPNAFAVSNYYLFSVAHIRSYWFLGLLRTWVPLDPKLLMLWLVANSSWASKLARHLLASTSGYGQWTQQFLSNPQWLLQVVQRFLQQV